MKPAPPVTSTRLTRRSIGSVISPPRTPPADAHVPHPRALDIFGTVDVPQIAEHRAAHEPDQSDEVQVTELVPFGHDHQGIRAPRRLVDVVGEGDASAEQP